MSQAVERSYSVISSPPEPIMYIFVPSDLKNIPVADVSWAETSNLLSVKCQPVMSSLFCKEVVEAEPTNTSVLALTLPERVILLNKVFVTAVVARTLEKYRLVPSGTTLVFNVDVARAHAFPL